MYDLIDGEPMNMANSAFSNTGDFQSIVLTPAQPPRARLQVRVVGKTAKLSAKRSADDGSIVQYAWKFGDGEKTFTMGPKVDHTYAKPGEYTVTVTATDDDECSTRFVSAGQTAYCNGGKQAVAEATVKVKKYARASSSARSTKVSKPIPAASAAIGSSEVSVMPGIELTSRTCGPSTSLSITSTRAKPCNRGPPKCAAQRR